VHSDGRALSLSCTDCAFQAPPHATDSRCVCACFEFTWIITSKFGGAKPCSLKMGIVDLRGKDKCTWCQGPRTVVGSPIGCAYFVRVVASDHTLVEIPRNVRVTCGWTGFDVMMRQAIGIAKPPQSGVILRYDLLQCWRSKNGYSTMPAMQTSPPRARLRLRRQR
jgi:hypothetical protein